jgi:putative ABC transport system permease protein
MFWHYFKTALKEIKRHYGFSLLNITGLVLGVTSCLLISLYVNFELGFDKFHKNSDNIYRVVMQQPGNQVRGSSSDWWIVSPYILKPAWEKELPEIKLACRTTDVEWPLKTSDQFINEDILVVDPEFFDVFTFPLISGNKNEVFSDTYSVVISGKMAFKYFGKIDPIGKLIEMNNGKVLSITGVLAEIPENTHLKCDFLVSFNTLEAINGKSLLSNNWLDNNYRTYILLGEKTDPGLLDSKLSKYDIEGFNGKKWSFHLQPLADIHFNREIMGSGNKETLIILITVGIFILLITGFNFMNLYIAHYRARIKNIAIRRFSGAGPAQLMHQLLSETFILVLISLILSLLFIRLVLPLFNDLVGEQLRFRSLMNFKMLINIFGIILALAFIAGFYPASYISRLRIIDGIKGGMEKFSKTSLLLRKAIMVLQFSVSILLVVGAVTIYKQLNYVTGKDLGYSKENILFMRLYGIRYKETNTGLNSRLETFNSELLKNPDVLKVAASSGIPSMIGWSNIPVWEGQAEGDNPFFYRLAVDENFLDLYGIEIAQGRGFSSEFIGEKGNAYILNEAAVKSLDLNNPVGSRFGFNKKLGTVVGVANDFHFESLHKPVTPLGIGFSDGNNLNFLSIKISNRDIYGTISYIENVWNGFTNNVPMEYTFVDDQVDQFYGKDNQLAMCLYCFSFIALFISCLGIFGLMSISIRERVRELGIRKIVGAMFSDLAFLLLLDILIIVGIATIIGGFTGGYIADQWLQNFSYHINRGFGIIILSFIIALLMAIIPVSLKLWKAITVEPVIAIKSDS